MKKIGVSLSIAGLFAMSAAQANEAITAANNEFGVQLGAQTFQYNEIPMPGTSLAPGSNGYLDSQSGTIPAIGFQLTRQGSLFGLPNIYRALSVNVAAGTTTYSTHNYTYDHCNGIPGTSWYCQTDYQTVGYMADHAVSVNLDVSGRLGKAFEIGPHAQITPYIEAGGHLWFRDSSNPAGGPGNPLAYYDQGAPRPEDYYWNFTAGLGVLSQYAVTDKLVVGVDLTALESFGANAEVNGTRYPLGSRPMVVAGVTADYAISKRLHATASYTFQHFRYGASPTESCSLSSTNVAQCNEFGSYEPSDWTTTQTVMIGIAWSY